jgi:uncharacterized membrane protein
MAQTDTAPERRTLRSQWSFLTPLWRRHPGVRGRSELTLGERAADDLRNGLGSWAFVFVMLGLLAAWMVYNRNVGFDPYPFILLNLMLSCLAAMQGAILLIAAKRSDQIASELAQHDFETDRAAAKRIEQVHARLEALENQSNAIATSSNGMLQSVLDELAAIKATLAPGAAS